MLQVLEAFCDCILRSPEESETDSRLTMRIVTFLVDHYADVMKTPETLKHQIDERINNLKRNKVLGKSP